MKKYLLALPSFLNLSVMNQAQSISSVTPLSTNVGRYEKFEAVAALTATYSNAYDYDQILLKGIFTAPSGRRDTVEGFYLQDYDVNTATGNLITKGKGEWRLRFSPNETGTWQYSVTVQTPTGTSAPVTGNFTCIASNAEGFVRKNASNYLSFDNGNQYIPVGQNLCWHIGNPYLSYKNWLEKMGAAKANFMRLWLCHWGLGLEWKNDINSGYEGLKKYKQNNAWYLDFLLEKCREQGIYVMLCINHHGQVSTQVNPNWNDNPYNTANGGMCSQTAQFFSHDAAKNAHKNRLRYIVARWGYSRHIMTWELFNEVNWTDAYSSNNTVKTDVRNWHDEMALYLKKIDPHQHLISTSFAANDDPLLWESPHMDYTQTHVYLSTPNIEKSIADESAKVLKDYKKPTLNGEFSIDVHNGSGARTDDPKGVHIHNTLWATALSGSVGAGATWWWDSYTDPQNLYGEFTPLSIFLQNIAFKTDNYKPTLASISGGGDINSDVSAIPSTDWAQATEANFMVSSNGLSQGRLGQYLYGSMWNTQYRNPPTFTVLYTRAGQFKVRTAGSTGEKPRISIYLNGNLVLDTTAAINQTYTINIPAGAHTIKVDNLGTDWIRIAEYIFTGIGGAPVNTYVLKSANNEKVTGWLHNRHYNWQELKTVPPPSVSNTNLTLSGMASGQYEVKFYSCGSGTLLSTVSGNSIGNLLNVALPNLTWDMAFTATRTGLVATQDLTVKNMRIKAYPNPVQIGSDLMVETEGITAGEWQVNILNINGQILRTEKTFVDPSTPFAIRIDGIISGLYILNMTNGQKAVSTRVRVVD